MSIIFVLASASFFIWIIRNTLFWVSLWQVKEYRFDRMATHLKETVQGKSLLFSPMLLIKYFVILAYGFIFLTKVNIFYQLVVTGIFIFEVYFVYMEYKQKIIKRPVFTLKSITLACVTIFIITLLFFTPFFERFFWLLLLDQVVFLLITFLVASFSFPTELYHDWQIEKATKKIQKHKKLLVIGATGSYGKSSTKEYIAQILEKKFTVLKTQGTNNTAIGVAQTILRGLKKETEIFVVEMGAYKKGEIAQICRMVHPQIGVLTGISDQHLSLFGSVKNTIDAKYELIDSLPRNGLALFNGNNTFTENLFNKTKKKKVLYKIADSLAGEEIKDKVIASHCEIKKTSLVFTVTFDHTPLHLYTVLIGKHAIENILPGIYIAKYLKMTDAEIKDAVSSLTPLSKTMVLQILQNGVSLVDDTFNASPNAVYAALDYMKIYKGKKFLILQPMIELGKNAQEEHYKLGKDMAKICDYVFVTNNNFYKQLWKGVVDTDSNCELQLGTIQGITALLKKRATKNDIIVFEGKEAGNVLRAFLS